MATSQRIRSLSHDESERTLSKPPVKSRIQSDNRSAKVMTVESTGPIFSTTTEPAIGPCNKSSFRLNDVEKSFNNVVKIVKTAFVEDEIKRAMESNWMLVETDAGEVSALDNALDTLRDAFLFTTSLSESKLDSSAHSIITHCEKVAERIFDQKESREVMVANWNDTNLLPNLQNNLQEIKTLVLPPLNRREKAAELKILKRIERFVSLMSSSLQAMRADLQSFLTDLDKILLECSTLLVEVITNFGIADSRCHNKQLEGLASLVRSLKARLEILFQRREVLVTAYYACIEAEFNIQKKLRVIEENIDVFASDPSVFHYCHEDEDQENGLLYLDK
ncbi:hypothetical protein DYB32_004147 [Aphanomyces invadans]|uniref:Uncharacterized protein n=1 Tax=Aphanomyces invadans TaxID=157072 RepID=A0A418AYF8_9STRA|nr:hypothetical protein DYB32_004147 [Aphanomyces invadans]